MKKIFFSAMLAAAMLASCSSESELKPAAGEVNDGAEGYVGFTIQLPTTVGTRANDEFDDGDPRPDEYAVKNATLFLFEGANEADAKFLAAYPMDVTDFNADGNATDQCTTEGVVTAEIIKPEQTNLYAYVMLNNNGMVEVTQANGTTTPASTTKVNGTDLAAGTTFANFSKLAMEKLGDAGNLVMTNAPVNDKVGGDSDPKDGNITTLAKLDKDNIFATKAKAQAHPAGEVYVERAAAKITVKAADAMAENAAITAEAGVTYSKASIKWAVNNVNKQYYNARQMQAAWLALAADGTEGTVRADSKYRFVSNAAIHNGVFRTYFAEDMNYNNGDVAGFNTNPTKDQIATKAQDAKSVYVTENTFDVANQSEKNTTGLSVSATFNGGKDFYIASTYGANKMLQAVGAGSSTVEDVQDYIKKYLVNNNGAFKAWMEAGATDFAVTMENDETTGTAKVKDVTGTNLPTDIDAAYINGLINFKFYKDGVAYYNVLIKHFGEDETPWNREKHTQNTIQGIYGAEPTATQNFLGRYGIVRNNWYQVEISGISQIGEPIVVTPGDTPDDKVNNYISVKIHILPWAVRKQTVIL